MNEPMKSKRLMTRPVKRSTVSMLCAYTSMPLFAMRDTYSSFPYAFHTSASLIKVSKGGND